MHHHASGVSIRHNLDHDYYDDDDHHHDYNDDDDNGDDNGDDVERSSVEAGSPSNRGGVRGESGHC